jgi:DNA-binding transcriptional MerR regulator
MSRLAPAVADDLMTAVDAARILGLSADMVRLLARDGRLPAAAETVRGVRLFRREEVETLAAERAGKLSHCHIAQFYEDDAFLLDAATDFLAEGLKRSEPLVAIATEAHRDALRARLAASGCDVVRACQSSQLTFIDARSTLERFLVDGMPDVKLFRRHVGVVVEERTKGRPRLRVYGEMVDLLCKQRRVEAAIRFEELWNDLARAHRLSRLCAYHLDHFRTGEDSTIFQRVCELHNRVIPTERYAEEADAQSRLRQIVLLQQQAHALEAEMRRRKLVEQELRLLKRKLGSEEWRTGAVP